MLRDKPIFPKSPLELGLVFIKCLRISDGFSSVSFILLKWSMLSCSQTKSSDPEHETSVLISSYEHSPFSVSVFVFMCSSIFACSLADLELSGGVWSVMWTRLWWSSGWRSSWDVSKLWDQGMYWANSTFMLPFKSLMSERFFTFKLIKNDSTDFYNVIKIAYFK